MIRKNNPHLFKNSSVEKYEKMALILIRKLLSEFTSDNADEFYIADGISAPTTNPEEAQCFSFSCFTEYLDHFLTTQDDPVAIAQALASFSVYILNKKSSITNSTILHIFSNNGNIEAVEILLKKGVKSQPDYWGDTPWLIPILDQHENAYQQLKLHIQYEGPAIVDQKLTKNKTLAEFLLRQLLKKKFSFSISLYDSENLKCLALIYHCSNQKLLFDKYIQGNIFLDNKLFNKWQTALNETAADAKALMNKCNENGKEIEHEKAWDEAINTIAQQNAEPPCVREVVASVN